MDQRADQHVVGFLGVEDVVRLEAEAAVASDEFVGAGADTGKVSQQTEGPFETRMISIGLIPTESGIRERVDIKQIATGSERKSVFNAGNFSGFIAPP